MVGFKMNSNQLLLILNTIIFLIYLRLIESAKVLDVNEKLPELIEKYPDKSWLVKFYAPWCHHCQQLEPTYANVAETIYHRYDDLIVARVDCTKSGRTCETYGIESYPSILFLSKSLKIKYNGDRTEESIINFSERLMKPSVNKVDSCDQLKEATIRHGIIVLSTIGNSTHNLHEKFKLIADLHKSEYWFYWHNGPCYDMQINEGIYIMKKYLTRPIEFMVNSSTYNSDEDLSKLIVDWMRNQSFPVFGQVHQRNIHQILALEKVLVLAILDKYPPAKKFASSSQKFFYLMQSLARDYTRYNDNLIFGWTSDVNLAEYITMSSISLPNLIFLKHNFHYHLLVGKDADSDNVNIPEGLNETSIRSKIKTILTNELPFDGGNSYLHTTLRQIFANYSKFVRMYRANPLLVSLIFGFPSIIIIFVIYTTCCYDGPFNDEDDEREDRHDSEDDEMDQLLGNEHLKQD